MLSTATTGAAPATYRALPAWQRAMDLAAACHALARRVRTPEHHALALRMRRAALALAAEIASGTNHSRPPNSSASVRASIAPV